MKKEIILFILCGEAFAGKSTMSKKLAEIHNAKIVGRDIVYFSLKEKLLLDKNPDEDDEAIWNYFWPVALQGTKNHLIAGNSVIFDDNCLYIKQRDELRALANNVGVKSILIYLNIPTEILQKRKADNKINPTRHDVPSAWLDEDKQIFERPHKEEMPLVYNGDCEIDEWLKKMEF